MSWWKSLFGVRTVAEDIRAGGLAATADAPPDAFVLKPESRLMPIPVAQRNDGLPNAFSLPSTGGEMIFDPALRGYECGFRQADAPIADPAARRRWSVARDQVVAGVLRAIAASPCASNLVLRGSATMAAWVGDAARRPADLDWVVLPDDWASTSAEAQALLRGFIDAIAAHGAQAGDATIDVANVAFDEIWTYERADGLRLTFSWSVPGIPPGKLQCDFVFKESLWMPPVPLALPSTDGDMKTLLAAGPEQSLAWKILWLMTDSYPQGKDLYDAVLLSDVVTLSPAMVDRTLTEIRQAQGAAYFDRWMGEGDDWLDGVLANVEWTSFAKEYPWIDASLDAWLGRFRKLIAPMSAQMPRDAAVRN